MLTPERLNLAKNTSLGLLYNLTLPLSWDSAESPFVYPQTQDYKGDCIFRLLKYRSPDARLSIGLHRVAVKRVASSKMDRRLYDCRYCPSYFSSWRWHSPPSVHFDQHVHLLDYLCHHWWETPRYFNQPLISCRSLFIQTTIPNSQTQYVHTVRKNLTCISLWDWSNDWQ